MKPIPWPSVRVWLPGALLSLALAAPAQAQQARAQADPARASTLGQALEAAWQRSLEAAESRARHARVQAEQALSQSWLAGAPALGLGQRESRSGASAGSRETEFELALPLWRPGQRAAGGRAAQSQAHWAQALAQAERLRLAGRLREAHAAVHLAEAELRQARAQADTLGQLADDVQRRVRAGDLAPADALAARSEWLAAQAQTSAAAQGLESAQAQWRLLTGLAPLEFEARPAPLEAALTQTHPERVLAAAALALGQRRAELARVDRPDAPALTLGLRQERPAQEAGTVNSVVMAIRLPVGGALYQQPRLAAALGELDLAQAQAQRTGERLDAEVALARRELDQSLRQLQLERERASLLAERARMLDKSFRAGETALPDMLRALAAAASAEAAHARQQVTHQRAMARLEQALGVLP